MEIRIRNLNRIRRQRVSVGVDGINPACLAYRAGIPSVDVEIECPRRAQLLEVRVITSRYQWLQINLERRFGREGPIGSRHEGERCLIDGRKYVAVAISAGGQWIAGCGQPLGERVRLLQIRLEAESHTRLGLNCQLDAVALCQLMFHVGASVPFDGRRIHLPPVAEEVEIGGDRSGLPDDRASTCQSIVEALRAEVGTREHPGEVVERSLREAGVVVERNVTVVVPRLIGEALDDPAAHQSTRLVLLIMEIRRYRAAIGLRLEAEIVDLQTRTGELVGEVSSPVKSAALDECRLTG